MSSLNGNRVRKYGNTKDNLKQEQEQEDEG